MAELMMVAVSKRSFKGATYQLFRESPASSWELASSEENRGNIIKPNLSKFCIAIFKV